MKAYKKFHSVSLALTFLILLLIIISPLALASPYTYIPKSGSNTVSVIDIPTDKVTAKVNVGFYPIGVAVSPDRKQVFVANQDSNTVSVIDTSTNTVTSTVNVGSNPE
jgi:YVTN family beta-propeller protein